MAFEQAMVKAPVAISDIVIRLKDRVDPVPLQEATFMITVVYDDGSETMVRGNLIPHLTAVQKTQIQAFMAEMRTKAETEVLPPP